MLIKLVLSFVILAVSFSSYAMRSGPNFVLLPNVKTQYLLSTNAAQATAIEQQSIDLVKKTLNIDASSTFQSVRIRIVYKANNQPQALIVYLLSSKYKSFELVRINLDDNFNVASIIRDYRLTAADLSQSPNYAFKTKPRCPDKKVQFVIGNNFTGDTSVEKEVQTVFALAKKFGYNPVLMDTNNPSGPQPTVQAYENWLSCPNVKAFYNESHGYQEGILLSDDDFMYSIIDKDLVNKLAHEIILFDSCDTFQDPLLSSVTAKDKGNAQQYIAGIVPLPFGSSERTATCIWTHAFNQQPLTQTLIENCAKQFGLDPDAYRITGNGDNFLHNAT